MTNREKIQASITFVPLTKEQQEFGLKGALEATDLVLSSDLKKQTIIDLRNQLQKQLNEHLKNE